MQFAHELDSGYFYFNPHNDFNFPKFKNISLVNGPLTMGQVQSERSLVKKSSGVINVQLVGPEIGKFTAQSTDGPND